MDTFVFRGKTDSANGNDWVCGCLVQYIDAAGQERSCILQGNAAEGFVWIPVLPASVGVCTGLQDRNGNFIFAGDIVFVPPQERICGFGKEETVQYQDGGFFPFAIPGWEITLTASECEVVGNVYDRNISA